jgi:P2 family phage major capsid protein
MTQQYQLSDQGRRALDQHFDVIRRVNETGASHDVSKKFAATPQVEQSLESLMQESVEFLGLINVEGTRDLKGNVVGMNVRKRLARRISRANLPRRPQYAGELTDRSWELYTSLFDTWLPWELIDQWSRFNDFSARYSRHVAQQIGLDRICIGWNGTSAAIDTDLVANPDLEDMNIGWMQKLRIEKPSHVMGRALVGVAPNQTATGADVPINVGNGAATYKNIDALAFDLISGMPSWARKSTDLVVVCGSKLVDDKYFPQINRPLAATVDGQPVVSDENVGKIIQSQKQIGGRPAIMVPEFPEDAMVITPLKNLTIKYQEGARRRYIREEPENMAGLADYNSSNEGYVIEDTDFMVQAENITFVP